MKIGILGAMSTEVAYLKEKINSSNSCKIDTFAGTEFYSGILCGKDVVVARCGVGKVNAAICTQIMIDKFDVTHVINTGVAGNLADAEINVCDIVVSTDVVQHDFDTSLTGDELGLIPGFTNVAFESDSAMLETALKIDKSVVDGSNIFAGRICTGDQYIGELEVKGRIIENFGGKCVEMEGGAIAHCCYLNNIPFLVIRSISDNADEVSRISFETFLELAAKRSSSFVEEFLRTF